jgi:putative hydrolase of the HAD superfamily
MIKHIFFDLDHTLWDFEKNSKETLNELFKEARLNEQHIAFNDFLSVYKGVNDSLWDDYRKGNVSKDVLRVVRFGKTLKQLGVYEKSLETFFTEEYINRSPLKKNLIPGTLDALRVLQEMDFDMHIITNGFREVQHTKLAKTGLSTYFKHVVTSDEIGVNKPDRRIFHSALRMANAKQSSSIMIGDHLMADIVGARRAGLKQGYFNPNHTPHLEKVTFEFSKMVELPQLIIG